MDGYTRAKGVLIQDELPDSTTKAWLTGGSLVQ